MKAARTVWTRGKLGDNIKELPIGIKLAFEGNSVAVTQDPLTSVDHTLVFTVDVRMGMDCVIGSKFGAIQLN